MRDTTEQRRASLSHLEQAWQVTTELGPDVRDYLIERAIDELNRGIEIKSQLTRCCNTAICAETSCDPVINIAEVFSEY